MSFNICHGLSVCIMVNIFNHKIVRLKVLRSSVKTDRKEKRIRRHRNSVEKALSNAPQIE